MISVREHIDRLEEDGDLVRLSERVHWADEAAVIASEAARENGPAVVFDAVPGHARLASGLYGGPDQMQLRERFPWSRIAMALGHDRDAPYATVLDELRGRVSSPSDAPRESLSATPAFVDLRSLGLPVVGSDGAPTITLGLLALSLEGTTVWAPIRGSVHGSSTIRAVIPQALADRLPAESPISIGLGVPAAALLGAHLAWMGEATSADAVGIATALDGVPLATANDCFVPSRSEVVLSGTLSKGAAETDGVPNGWEYAVPTVTAEISVTSIATREDPLIPFSPTGAPLADDLQLASLAEAARLSDRVNNYWGVEPVEWVVLPVETRLGMCLVASEILYAGFEWQLANTLFSFSRLFDKIIILDADTPPADLARGFDDMWVKAHPSNDWEFSEADAPAATTTAYRRDGQTGSRVYIDATWDPRWDEEYIAPRVGFETSYPADVREFVTENWKTFGFDSEPDGR